MSILIFIVMLFVLIVGHEFGHLVAAKLSKMKVLEFGVGFPPKLAGKMIGGTEYTVNALPFGGFVKIFGEDAEDAGESHAFSSRPKILQAATIAAGPLMNLILAFILTSTAFMVGVPAQVDPSDALGVRDVRVIAAEILPGTPADEAGLKAGDRLISLVSSGVESPILTPEGFSSAIEKSEGPLSLTYQRGEDTVSIELTPATGVIAEEPERRALGVGLMLVGTKSFPFFEAIGAGFTTTLKNTALIGEGLARFIGQAFSFQADLSAVAGPVGIVSSVGDAATFGIGALFSFAALISINLAIVNLIPFPALDGGRLAFIAIEAITRRTIPRSVANMLNIVGFALLILLMLAVTANDISKLVG